MNKAIFLDRDGVLCDAIVRDGKPCSARTMNEITIWPETILNCARLKEAGYKLLCFSNQPDIARGFVSEEIICEQNTLIVKMCNLDEIITCPHDNNDNCSCRKPKPGMIYTLAWLYSIDLIKSYVIGDRWSDISAAHNAGITQAIYLDFDYDEERPKYCKREISFTNATNYILGVNE